VATVVAPLGHQLVCVRITRLLTIISISRVCRRRWWQRLDCGNHILLELPEQRFPLGVRQLLRRRQVRRVGGVDAHAGKRTEETLRRHGTGAYVLIVAGNVQGFAVLEGAEGLLAIVTTEVH